jgi:hypothetical protein
MLYSTKYIHFSITLFPLHHDVTKYCIHKSLNIVQNNLLQQYMFFSIKYT